MKIVCVNFRFWRNKEIKIKPGTVLLKGAVGTGKTTTLESIQYALYGCTKQYSHGAKSCTVTLSIDPDIVIQRNSGPGRLVLQSGGQKYEGMYAQQIINNMFGSEEVFIAGSYCKSGKECALLTGSNDDKMTLLRAISFRQDNVELAYTRVSDALKKSQEVMALAEREFIISQRELENHRKAYPRLEIPDLNVEELNVDELSGEVKQIEAAIKSTDAKLKNVLQLETKIATLKDIVEISGIVPQMENEAELRAELNRLEIQESELRSKLHKLEVQQQLKKASEKQQLELEQLVSEIATLSSSCDITDANADSEENRILTVIKSYKHLGDTLKSFGVTGVGELRAQIGQLGNKIEDVKKEIISIQDDIDAKRWNENQSKVLSCPSCQAALCFDDHVLKMSDISIKLDLKAVKNEHANETMMNSLRQSLAEMEVRRSKIQSNISELAKLSTSVQEPSEADKKKLEVIQKRKTLISKCDTLKTIMVKYEDMALETKETLETTLQEVMSRKDTIMLQLKQFLSEKTRHDANLKKIKEFEACKTELGSQSSVTIETDMADMRTKLTETKEMRDVAIGIIKTLEIEARYTRHAKELDSLNIKHERLKQFQTIIKQTEIAILERSVQILNQQINHFLSILFHDENRMTVNFSTTKETKSGKERMTCNISIFHKNEHYDSYTELSGGERGGLSIAVMLAINCLTDGKIIMFDETFKTLDSPFEIRVLTMLKNYVGNKKICIVSGHNMLEGVFDSIEHF